MPTIQMRDGAALQLQVIGRGQPVLMLSGLGMDARSWLPFVLPHTRRFQFYLPDFRGQGRSAKTMFNQSDVFQNHMEDVQDVIAHFDLNDFLLAGISLGATTALHLQRETGLANVRGYLHVDQSPCVVNGDDWRYGLGGVRQLELFASMQALLALLAEHSRCEFVDQLPSQALQEVVRLLGEILATLGLDGAKLAAAKRLAQLPAAVLRHLPLMNTKVLAAYMRAYSGGGHDYRPSLGRDDIPVTVMVGMRSPLYEPVGQMSIADHYPRGSVVRFEHSGHAPLMSEPRKFFSEFGRFLNRAD